jgi:signal transduction histidine kinase
VARAATLALVLAGAIPQRHRGVERDEPDGLRHPLQETTHATHWSSVPHRKRSRQRSVTWASAPVGVTEDRRLADDELVARDEHELRGAATALALACERLRRDPAAGSHAAMIDAQLDRLRAGLDDLDAARAHGAGGSPPAEGAPGTGGSDEGDATVELGALTRAAAMPWEPSFEWEGGAAPASIDRRRFAKALGNVLANAAKHGSGDIRVTGRAHNGGVRLQVRNRGRGLMIASDAAEELGGSLKLEIVDDTAVATLDLPAA